MWAGCLTFAGCSLLACMLAAGEAIRRTLEYAPAPVGNPLKGLTPGTYKLALRVPTPLPKRNPVRFALRTQDSDAKGWLTLDEVAWE